MRTKEKIRPRVERYGGIGLVSFVSLPFPLTGGWTGAIAAFLIGIPFNSAFLTITFGTLIKGVIISAFTLSGIAVERYFGWETLLIIVTISFLAYFVKKIKDK